MPSIADRDLPVSHDAERHHIDGVVSTPALIFGAIHDDDDDQRDPVLTALLKVREAPSRLLARVGVDATLRERERFGPTPEQLTRITAGHVLPGLRPSPYELIPGAQAARDDEIVEVRRLQPPNLLVDDKRVCTLYIDRRPAFLPIVQPLD